MPTEARGNYLHEPPYLRETKTYHSQPLESTRHAGNYFVPLSIRSIFIFFVADVMSNYLTTDGLKKISLLPEAPLRPEGRGICHICHMVNSALHKPVVLGVAAASGGTRNFRQGVRQSVAFLSVHSRSAALPSRPYNQKTHIKSHMPKMYFPDKPLTPLVWLRHWAKPPIFTCLPLIAPYFSGYSTGCLATPHAWPR